MKKSEEDFYLRNDTGKRRTDCKECYLARGNAYRKENRGEILAQKKAYRKENRVRLAANQRVFHTENREEILTRQRAYQKENRESILARKPDQSRFCRYRITADDFKHLLHEQGGVCAICGGLGGKKGLCVDHDHDSRKIRALLCSTCNSAIGFLKDSSDMARRALEYLKKYGK